MRNGSIVVVIGVDRRRDGRDDIILVDSRWGTTETGSVSVRQGLRGTDGSFVQVTAPLFLGVRHLLGTIASGFARTIKSLVNYVLVARGVARI